MTADQKRVASWIALGLLVLGLLALAWLNYLAANSSFVSDPKADDPTLRLSWKIALWFIELGTSAKVLFAVVISIISAGVASAGELYKSTARLAMISVLCLAGIGLSILLMVLLLGDDSNGEVLRYFSTYDTLPELEKATSVFMWALLGWFATFLASQLGISALKEGGAVKNLLSRFSG